MPDMDVTTLQIATIALIAFFMLLTLIFTSVVWFKLRGLRQCLNEQTLADESFQQRVHRDLQDFEARFIRRACEDRDSRQYHHQLVTNALEKVREHQNARLQALELMLLERLNENRTTLSDSMHAGMDAIRQQIHETLKHHSDQLGARVEGLTQITDRRLQEIGGQVEQRLSEGFEKTTATFADVLKRLAMIDEAQKRITELSTNVVSLQQVLADKRSRGAFGEVQLAALVRNVLPENHFALQYGLSNQTRCDCILFLPQPTGNMVIDAKFPLDSFSKMTDTERSELERKAAEKQFKNDVRKHVDDIAEKYILPGETADGAVMFIPAEAVFAEIHAHHTDVVEYAQRKQVWLASPTTLMAILTTARAVLKDEATREQVHVIQEHLVALSKDFDRFQLRMDDLVKHISQAHQDVEKVGISAKKITRHFKRIEEADLNEVLPLQAENNAK